MPTERKVAQVAELSEKLSRAQLTIVADYRGLTVADMQNLRGQLRPHGSEMQVTKNTLTAIAARQVGLDSLEEALTGPTALIFVYDEIAATAKTVSDFARISRIMTVRGGLLGNRLVGPEDVTSLATLPPKEHLQAQVLGAIAGPVSGLIGIFNSVAQALVSIVDQKAQQMGGGEAAEAADSGAGASNGEQVAEAAPAS
jgi:large subunit ribosomal protein L10